MTTIDQKSKLTNPSLTPVEIRKRPIVNFAIRYFWLLIIIAPLLVMGIGIYLFILPKYNEIINRSLTSVSSQYDWKLKRSNYLTQLKEQERIFQAIPKSDIDKIESMLPVYKGGEEEILAQLEYIVFRNGLLLNGLSINMNQDKKVVALASEVENNQVENNQENSGNAKVDIGNVNLREVDITLSVSGLNYIGLKSFLSVLENNLRIFDIKGLTYNPDGLSLSLQMTTYYLDK